MIHHVHYAMVQIIYIIQIMVHNVNVHDEL